MIHRHASEADTGTREAGKRAGVGRGNEGSEHAHDRAGGREREKGKRGGQLGKVRGEGGK
jgi:hypothetical protein